MTASIRNIVVWFVSQPAAVRLAVAVLSFVGVMVFPMAPINGGN